MLLAKTILVDSDLAVSTPTAKPPNLIPRQLFQLCGTWNILECPIRIWENIQISNYLRTSSWRPAADGWFVVACCEAEEGNFPKPWPDTSTDDPKQYKRLVECQTHQYKTEQRGQDNSQHSNPIGQWEEMKGSACTYFTQHGHIRYSSIYIACMSSALSGSLVL